MWGNTQVLRASDTLSVNTPGVQGQTLRVGYGRPDTWHWTFAARLLEGDEAQIGEQHVVQVDFALTVGIGRAAIILPRFEQFRWRWGNNTTVESAPIGDVKFSTSSLGPVRWDPSLGDTDPWEATRGSLSNVISEITAQDIQLQTTLTVSTLGSLSAAVEISAQFAPKVHIRPEWHLHRFPGGEHG